MMVLLEMVYELFNWCERDVSCMQYGCVWSYVEDVAMTYSDGLMQMHNEVKKWHKTTCLTGAGSSHTEGSL